jgi:hypothetical protein
MNELTRITIYAPVSDATRHTVQVAASMCGTEPTDRFTAYSWHLERLVVLSRELDLPFHVLLGRLDYAFSAGEFDR